jgi:hypothetical protein
MVARASHREVRRHKGYGHITNQKIGRHCHPSSEVNPSLIIWNQALK